MHFLRKYIHPYGFAVLGGLWAANYSPLQVRLVSEEENNAIKEQQRFSPYGLSSSHLCRDSIAYLQDNNRHIPTKTHECSIKNKRVPGCSELMVFTGNAHRDLAYEVARLLGTQLADCYVGRFSDGEVKVNVAESVRGKDVYVIQPTSPPVNENLIELLLLVSTLRHASAKRVTVVLPYFGYMRSAGISTPQLARKIDRMMSRRQAKAEFRSNRIQSDTMLLNSNTTTSNLAAADVAKMLEVVGSDRIVTFDLQPPGQGQAEGFFQDVPVETLQAEDIIAAELAEKLNLKERNGNSELVVVAPKTACLTKAKIFRSKLAEILKDDNIGLATIIRTPTPEQMSKKQVDVVGKVKDKKVLIVVDVVDTGGSVCRAAEAVKAEGAKNVYAFASHALLSGASALRIQNSPIEELVVLDTLPISKGRQTSII